MKCLLLHCRLSQTQQYNRVKFDNSRTVHQTIGQPEATPVYHRWDSSYEKIGRRPKILKPMVKDSYMSLKGITNQAVRSITTEQEYSLPLISPSAVKVNPINIQIAPRRTGKQES